MFDCVVGAKICGRGMSESAVFVSRIQACRMKEGTGQDKQEGTEKTIQCSGCVRCGTMLWDDGDGKSLGRVELLGDAEVGWPR